MGGVECEGNVIMFWVCVGVSVLGVKNWRKDAQGSNLLIGKSSLFSNQSFLNFLAGNTYQV